MIVLGIETSCDETAVSLFDGNSAIVEIIYTQSVHSSFGGVVPELASRHHIKKLYPMVKSALGQSKITAADIDAIAVTAGPGLPGALLVGATFAKGFAYARNIPIVAVNHLEGHIFAAKLGCEIEPPFLALLVSGGHTEIAKIIDWGEYKTLGATRDDAAGEAFDKVAQVLGLPYPGGPEIQMLAEQGNPNLINFPRAMMKSGNLDFSFSGLKTAVINLLYDWGADKVQKNIEDISASFQEAVVDTLLGKLKIAVEETGIDTVAIVGGVAANERLRIKSKEMGWNVCIPPLKYCTDNGTMIAAAGYFHLQKAETTSLTFSTKPNWELDEI
ncbi:tRNA (adenosine(37)-N6)-threonylcarbamoyltransferase complex transferase subunit TsaD [bacterium]|nr:tRNA (adenosine(37)-N6)-threonylcarbamoyltransferase complex transferase subunit TsaD [bacterium]